MHNTCEAPGSNRSDPLPQVLCRKCAKAIRKENLTGAPAFPPDPRTLWVISVRMERAVETLEAEVTNLREANELARVKGLSEEGEIISDAMAEIKASLAWIQNVLAMAEEASRKGGTK